MSDYRGECSCGAIRFAVAGSPSVVCLCHCADCRRAVGASPVAWATFRRDALELLSQAPTWYRSSARAERGHCARCGTSLFHRAEAAPDELDICSEALSPPRLLAPQCHIWVCERAPFTKVDDGLPRHVGDSRSPLRDPALLIRTETPADAQAVRCVHTEAFVGSDEFAIVDRLRDAGALTLSLVAEREGQVLGHIACSPVTVDGTAGERAEGIGLGPVGVLPAHQRQSIGTQLVAESLGQLRRAGHSVVFLLGHTAFYPRFGFTPAARYGLRWEHAEPTDAFMLHALQPRGVPPFAGVVRYRPELGGG